VVARLPDGVLLEGESATIDDSGALLLKRGKANHRLNSAEISLRIA
jgi:biotin-(acetyl-CoA carboxylase) ligase